MLRESRWDEIIPEEKEKHMDEMTLPTVNINELTNALKDKIIKELKEAQIPIQQTTGLQEGPATQVDALEDYKPKLIEMMKQNWTGGFIWKGKEDSKMFEAIGAASAGSAVPEIWAKDVFRCCPYPASAFLYAPYIKWHDDIKGKFSRVFKSGYMVNN